MNFTIKHKSLDIECEFSKKTRSDGSQVDHLRVNGKQAESLQCLKEILEEIDELSVEEFHFPMGCRVKRQRGTSGKTVSEVFVVLNSIYVNVLFEGRTTPEAVGISGLTPYEPEKTP